MLACGRVPSTAQVLGLVLLDLGCGLMGLRVQVLGYTLEDARR